MTFLGVLQIKRRTESIILVNAVDMDSVVIALRSSVYINTVIEG